MYDTRYFEKRRMQIDRMEWYDIHWGLKAAGARKGDFIVDLGAGGGYLVDFLRARGFRVIGLDLVGDGEKVHRCDLEVEDPPLADYYVFQHFLEHIRQERALELLSKCYRQGKAVVGILPGHWSDDETHVINHYPDILKIVEHVKPACYCIRPDTLSYVSPRSRDWLLILSKKTIRKPVRGTMPLHVLAPIYLLGKVLKFFYMKA